MKKKKEEFKQIIIDEEPTKYWISNYGRVWSENINGFRKFSRSNSGTRYEFLRLESHNFLVHRLVAVYFCEGRTKERNIVNHIDGNIFNNYFKNLEWTTAQENCLKGQMRTGRHFLGNATGCVLYKNELVVGEFKSISQAAKYASQRGASATSLQKYYKDGNGWEIKKEK